MLSSKVITIFSLILYQMMLLLSPPQLTYCQHDTEALMSGGSEPRMSAESHRIVATGWPSTSPLWPNVETAESSGQPGASSIRWPELVEPFIYADKPQRVDYSLLLALNETVISILKSMDSQQLAVNLSFEYYFDHHANITSLPVVKIEVNRKEEDHLEPGERDRRMWIKYNRQIVRSDVQQFAKHDWLKLSMVNRESPSLVAIRRLKVEFAALQHATTTKVVPATPAPVPAAASDVPVDQATDSEKNGKLQKPPLDQPVSEMPEVPAAPTKSEPTSSLSPPFTDSTDQPSIGSSTSDYSPQSSPGDDNYISTGGAAGTSSTYQEPSSSSESSTRPSPSSTTGDFYPDQGPPADVTALATEIKPVKAKPANWWPGKRRKRDAASSPSNSTSSQQVTSVVLTCYRSDDCEWRADSGERIQWSLARQPPSTAKVQSGYFYNSNRDNYGDSTKMLSLSLNQTESATVVDQNSDHCIELALYITERTYLRLYRLIKRVDDNKDSSTAENDPQWIKGNLLLTWAPTMSTQVTIGNSTQLQRSSLPNSTLASMENGLNGWTLETLCFGDFFADSKGCGAGNCALGFMMETDVMRPSELHSATDKHLSTGEMTTTNSLEDLLASSTGSVEQVVGVALLNEYATNTPVHSVPKWLETWQRDEVEPTKNWRFYPKLDYLVKSTNVSLMNLYDDAHYLVASDWMNVEPNLDLSASLLVELNNNSTLNETELSDLLINATSLMNSENGSLFNLRVTTKLVDSNFDIIYSTNTTIDWQLSSNSTLYNLNLPASDHLKRTDETLDAAKTFKVLLEMVLDTHWVSAAGEALARFLAENDISYRLSLANVSIAERCFPNPCQFGTCQQNGTGYEDWNCSCDEKHRGRHCEFGRWCNLAHVTPWQPSRSNQQVVLKTPGNGFQRQPKLALESVTRVTGEKYCQAKLGAGFRCTDIDLPLNDNLYTEEDKTFVCSCQDDFYLSDDSKCRQAHLCSSIVCPSVGQICDESRPFNRTQPCQCDQKQDWFADPQEPSGNRCIRRQCHDKQRDCQFDAHVCIPTLPGERPICKCGPKFALKTDAKGQKYCQSTACVLPTLNDCQQVCQPDNSNLERPYTCACHPGYVLAADGRTCHVQRPHSPPHCRPACNVDTQICTDVGCKCKQGFASEDEVIAQQTGGGSAMSNQHSGDYVKSVRCLNVCSLTYAENKDEFERIESVCPLGLCSPNDFQCRCSDPTSSALINTKYEPVYAPLNESSSSSQVRQRVSPLCHLRRVCEPNSSSFQICKSQGAICVPDYTKAAMFDCICPPSTEKRFFGQATASEFTCEAKCATKKYDCLRRQAVCKLVDKDQVKCDCLPGFLFNEHDQKCYLARYAYAFNLLLVNRYYEPESKFHKLEYSNTNSTAAAAASINALSSPPIISQSSSNQRARGEPMRIITTVTTSDRSVPGNELSSQILPQYLQTTAPPPKSLFIADYNQCNISQVIPKSVIEDPYEHDVESFFGYIDQCNAKIHENSRTYHLNSKLSEDLRQALRQHLRDFTVTTNNSTCVELDSQGAYLNCTVYLQSNEPVAADSVEYVLNDCDPNGQNDSYCWIKPRLLLKKPTAQQQQSGSNATSQVAKNKIHFRQVIPCEIDGFCGQEAISVRLDDKTSLCSCKCPTDIEVVDAKDLEQRNIDSDPTKVAVKEVCAPRNLCGNNSTVCLAKPGSVCQYDIRVGTKCNCVYPSYEDSNGSCVEVTFSRLDSSLIVIVIVLGTSLIVSIAINLAAMARFKSYFGRSKQYPLNEFPPSRAANNRSTGIPNYGFSND